MIAPFRLKKIGSTSGVYDLLDQCQDSSLFNVIKINVNIVVPSGLSIPATGEVNIYFDTLDGSEGHESLSFTLDESIRWGDPSTYLSNNLGEGTHPYQDIVLISGKNGAAPWPHCYLNKPLHSEVVVYAKDIPGQTSYGHISEWITASVTTGGNLQDGGTYTITITGYNPS